MKDEYSIASSKTGFVTLDPFPLHESMFWYF